VIVLDTTILVYAVGDDHALRESARAIVDAVGSGTVHATTTAEAIQEFVHVRARRRDRRDAVAVGRAYADLLSPLLPVDEDALRDGLELYQRHEALGCFDAVLAAAARSGGHEALVSADSAFGTIENLPFVDLADAARVRQLLG
jgi:predicted nucleic acid-binding protein